MKVIKRDGKIADFDKNKVMQAIAKAGKETGEFGKIMADFLSNIVVTELENEQDGILPKPEKLEELRSKIDKRKPLYSPGIFLFAPITSIHYIPSDTEDDQKIIDKLKTTKVPAFISAADYSNKKKIN